MDKFCTGYSPIAKILGVKSLGMKTLTA